MENQNTEKTQYQKDLLKNRLSKQYKTLKKWARKNDITSYRLYDKDIPEIPLCLDLYTFTKDSIKNKQEALADFENESKILSENTNQSKEVLQNILERTYLHMCLYQRPYEKSEEEENLWLEEMALTACQVIGIEKDHVIIKKRRKQSKSEERQREQYEKIQNVKAIKGNILEQGQLFKINLTEYIDTGLFFDHRPLRKVIRETSENKSVLNLFCYTGSFSLYAASGQAKSVHSVDMSKTYIEWAKENFLLNGLDTEDIFINEAKTKSYPKYTFTRQDAIGFLNQQNAEVPNQDLTNRYDIIILDPPTFSNSKRTDHALDINSDWPSLVAKCLNLLNKDGILYFSTNSRRLAFSTDMLPKKEDSSPLCQALEITEKTIPQDYRNQKIHRVWKITKI